MRVTNEQRPNPLPLRGGPLHFPYQRARYRVSPHFRFDRRADEVVESLFPIDGHGKIGVLRCGIDASTRDGTKIFTVAAVGYGMESAKKANRKWNAALKGRTFHMTDLNARQEEFEGISDDEVDETMKAIVSVVCKHSFSVVAVACDASEVEEFLPRVAARDAPSQEVLAAMRSTYGLMCHLCMAAVGDMCRGPREVAYTLESGDDGQRGLIRYLDFVEDQPESEQFRDLYSFGRKTVGPKKGIDGLFHSADLVAWEYGKYVERRLADQTAKRTSFKLIEAGTNNYLRYFPPENIKHFLGIYQRILSATRREEVDEAIRHWREVRASAQAQGQSQFFPVRL